LKPEEYDLINTDDESEHGGGSGSESDEFSMYEPTTGEEPESPWLCEEQAPASGTFKFIMNVRAILILLLALLWVYEQV